VVRPALARGAIVLTDRHVDSSVAYQSGGRGLAAEDVVALSAFATEGVRPELVVLLDLDPAIARARREERTGVPDKLEAEAGDFHARVRATFLARAKQDPERYLVLDADQGPQILTGAIQDRLDQLLPPSAAEAEAAARREAALAAAIAKEREFQAAKAAEEAEARAEAEAEERKRREEELAERQAAEQERARKAAEDRTAREAAQHEAQAQAQADEAERTETQKREAERREQERRIQTQQDALRRREAELTVRQAEARAKERARLAAAAAKAAQEQARRQPSLADDLMHLGHAEADEEHAQVDEEAAEGPDAEGEHS
jgi:dTMP kinase